MKNVDMNKLIKELSRDEFGRKPTKVFPSKVDKATKYRKTTRDYLVYDSDDDS